MVRELKILLWGIPHRRVSTHNVLFRSLIAMLYGVRILSQMPEM